MKFHVLVVLWRKSRGDNPESVERRPPSRDDVPNGNMVENPFNLSKGSSEMVYLLLNTIICCRPGNGT